jgi:hypothetical protein
LNNRFPRACWPPHSCTGGSCTVGDCGDGTARLCGGEVTQTEPDGLAPEQRAEAYVLIDSGRLPTVEDPSSASRIRDRVPGRVMLLPGHVRTPLAGREA